MSKANGSRPRAMAPYCDAPEMQSNAATTGDRTAKQYHGPMDFQWWMLLPLIPLTVLGLVAFKVFRVRRRGRRFLQLSRAERLEFARLLLRDGSLPVIPRLVVAGAAGYLALPIDLIPDFLPVVGHADDFLVVTLLIAIITRTVPPDRLEQLVLEARRDAPTANAVPGLQ